MQWARQFVWTPCCALLRFVARLGTQQQLYLHFALSTLRRVKELASFDEGVLGFVREVGPALLHSRDPRASGSLAFPFALPIQPRQFLSGRRYHGRTAAPQELLVTLPLSRRTILREDCRPRLRSCVAVGSLVQL